VRSFPANLTAKIFHYPVKANFTVASEQEIAKPPTVDFGTAAAQPPEASGPAK
jgi:LemA protein